MVTPNYSIPNIYSKAYLENCLKKHFNKNIRVSEMETLPAAGKGEGYCSIMTKIVIVYKELEHRQFVEKKIHLIGKSAFENEPHLFGILTKYDVFNTEMEMYQTVFPELHKLLHSIGDNDQLCPNTIHVDKERNLIILEDLSVRNYSTANRLQGMDEPHMRKSLKKLAKMHAAAATLNERQNGCLEKYCHGIFNRHVNCYGIFFENTTLQCARFAESCPELGEYYRDKLIKLIPHISEYATRCYDPKPKHFLTLNHGDMWTNNVLVQYDECIEGNPMDVLLIDFQYCNWTSPAVDLFYFLNTSLENDLLLNRQTEFIQHYHETLTNTLKKLNYRQHIPTLHELHVQLLERGFYAVTSLLTNFPLMINDKTEDADFEAIVGNDEKSKRFHQVLYENERVRKIIKIMLPRLDQMGLLDVQE